MNDDTPISNAAESEHMKVHGQSTFNVIATCRQLERLLDEAEDGLVELFDFVQRITMHLQKTPDYKQQFHEAYHLYVKYDVEFNKNNILTKLAALRAEARKGKV